MNDMTVNPTPVPHGWFITGTDTGVGKTVIAAAIARLCYQANRRVGVFKPIATGCRFELDLGLVSEDTEFLAHCAESADNLFTITPVRYADPVAPMVAVERTKRPIDYEAIDEAYRQITSHADVIIIEGIGGLLVPLDKKKDVADLAKHFDLPLIIVANAGLGAINHTRLTVEAARARNLKIAAVVLNQYNPSTPTLAEETNPQTIARLCKVPPPIVIPQDDTLDTTKGHLPKSITNLLRPFINANLRANPPK